MKKVSVLVGLMMISFLTGCASHPQKERVVASKEFECRFSETVDGEKMDFVFTPDALKLSIAASKSGNEMLYLEEDNFVSGGFTYVQAKGKEKDWVLSKIEFISYAASPKVTLNFKRTPASKALSFSKECAL